MTQDAEIYPQGMVTKGVRASAGILLTQFPQPMLSCNKIDP